MSDDLNTLQVIGLLEKAYPYFFAKMSETQAEGTIALYVECLQDLDPVDLRMAVMQHVTNDRFFPTIADLRKAVGDMHERVLGLASAHEAWGEVEQAFLDVGYMRTPEFSNPLIAKVVTNLGWKNLCMSETKMSDRAQFLKAYETLVQREREDQRMLPVVREHLETKQAKQLDAGQEIKKLADKWSAP